MKATGIVRKIDELGRIVIPKELRRTLNIEDRDSLEIYVESDHVIFKKYNPSCAFCGNMEDMVEFHGKNICKKCIDEF